MNRDKNIDFRSLFQLINKQTGCKNFNNSHKKQKKLISIYPKHEKYKRFHVKKTKLCKLQLTKSG